MTLPARARILAGGLVIAAACGGGKGQGHDAGPVAQDEDAAPGAAGGHAGAGTPGGGTGGTATTGTAGASGAAGRGGAGGSAGAAGGGGPGGAAGAAGRSDAGAADAGDGGGAPGGGRTLSMRYCPQGVQFGDPLAGAAKPQRVTFMPAGKLSFVEGPAWIAASGLLLFSDFTAPGDIYALTPPDHLAVFVEGANTNGMALAPDDRSILAAIQGKAPGLSRVGLADKKIEVIATAYNGEKFKGPNDLTVRADGTTYMTDLDAGRLYRITPAGQVSLISSRSGSNGVALSPDEKTLYLNTGAVVYRYTVNPDGTTAAEAPFASGLMTSDGITVDCAGDVYVAQYTGTGLAVFAPDGKRIGSVELGVTQVTNAAFGGADRKTLFITAGGNGLWTVVLAVPGLPY